MPEGTGTAPEVDWDPHGVFGGDDGNVGDHPDAGEVVGRLLRPGGRAGIEHDETTRESDRRCSGNRCVAGDQRVRRSHRPATVP